MNSSSVCNCLNLGLTLRAAPQAASGAPRPAVLLFHGMTGTPDEMAGLAEFIHTMGYDVFAPCLSGHGQTIEELRKTRAAAWLADSRNCLNALEELGFDEVVVIGLSFGCLLALELATSCPGQVRGIVLMSAPLCFKRRKVEIVLTLLSFLPERLLDLLGTAAKEQRPEGIFIKERVALETHSLGASARLFKIRRRIKRRLRRISAPVLVLHDPYDHHLSSSVPEQIRSLIPSPVQIELLPGGQHELPIGHSYREVFAAIERFLQELPRSAAAGGGSC